MLASAKDVHSVHLITRKFDEVPMDDLRSLSDDIKAGRTGYALVLASVAGGKVTFLCSLTDDLVKKGYHAGKMIKEIARAAGGGGGGKPDMAQAGAKDPSKVEAAFATAEKLLQTIV